METINRIEICGIVGSVNHGNTYSRLTVATNFVYTDSMGTPIIETTWHTIIAKNCPDIKKGDKVHLVGRLRNSRYTTPDGVDLTTSDIMTNEVSLIKD